MKKGKKKKLLKSNKIKKGFTLVELLAVIIILAIIMIIAIPSVLSTMEQAKQKTFIEYVQKVYKRTQEQYLEDTTFGNIPRSSGENYYVYDITKDLKMSGTGGFKGMVIYWVAGNNYSITVIVYDDTYMFGAIVESVSSDTFEISLENLHKKSEFESVLGFEVNEDTMNYDTVYNVYLMNKCREHDYTIYKMSDMSTRTLPQTIDYTQKDACEATNDTFNVLRNSLGF